jgi:ubiquinone/menaquinone biosynthesis C-methylase UbiE
MSLPFGRASFPEIYEHHLVGPLFRPWAEVLLGEVALQPGERVLDVACGTGIVARLARERTGAGTKVLGVDSAAPMIAVARSVEPDIDWRVGDAAALPLEPGEQFDVVLCQQGMQFFPDRAGAAREMRRALTPGGRLAVSTWQPDEAFPVLRELRRIAERHLGPITDRRHGYGEPAPLERLLRDTGFRDVRSKAASRAIRFADGALFVRLNALALLGMTNAPASEEARERLLEAIGRDSAELVRANTDANGFAYEIGATIVTARAS